MAPIHDRRKRMQVIVQLLLAEVSTMTPSEMNEIREILDNEEFDRIARVLLPKKSLSGPLGTE